jgi:hypothetical protein
MKQKRMALYLNSLCSIAIKLMIKCLKENYPELKLDISNIKLKNSCQKH